MHEPSRNRYILFNHMLLLIWLIICNFLIGLAMLIAFMRRQKKK